MTTKHTITFVSDYGKLWTVNYTMRDGDVEGVNWVKIGETYYDVKTVKRETTIINTISNYVDLFEFAADDIAEREHHHMVDDNY